MASALSLSARAMTSARAPSRSRSRAACWASEVLLCVLQGQFEFVGVEAGQQVAGADRLAGLDVDLGDRAGDIETEPAPARRFDHSFGDDRSGAQRDDGNLICGCAGVGCRRRGLIAAGKCDCCQNQQPDDGVSCSHVLYASWKPAPYNPLDHDQRLVVKNAGVLSKSRRSVDDPFSQLLRGSICLLGDEPGQSFLAKLLIGCVDRLGDAVRIEGQCIALSQGDRLLRVSGILKQAHRHSGGDEVFAAACGRRDTAGAGCGLRTQSAALPSQGPGIPQRRW